MDDEIVKLIIGILLFAGLIWLVGSYTPNDNYMPDGVIENCGPGGTTC